MINLASQQKGEIGSKPLLQHGANLASRIQLSLEGGHPQVPFSTNCSNRIAFHRGSNKLQVGSYFDLRRQFMVIRRLE